MKKIKYLVFLLGLCLLGITSVNAASFKVSANKTTVVVGNSVNVTVSVSGSDAAGWEYCLNYDTSVFSLTSHSSSCVLGGTLAGNKSVTFKLKAKASGSTTFTLRDADILDDAAVSVLKDKGSVKVTAKTQAEIEASYSTNADLKSLSVEGYEITPVFNKNTLEYELEVENEIEKVTIKAGKADSSASISGTGEKELTEGLNKFEIVVTAEKGNKKTYVVNITRKELNPIHVDVDGDSYTIIRKADVLEAPTYYSSTEVEIQNELVPAFKSDITGYVLVGLKDENGNISLYRYDDAVDKYTSYQQLNTSGIILIPLTPEKAIDGYNQVRSITVNNEEVNGYGVDSTSEFVLVYGMNASNGETGWYKYDTDEGTFQRYVEIKVKEEEKQFDLYFILTAVFAGLSFITILLVIVLLSMNSKLRKKNKRLVGIVEETRNKSKKEEVPVVEEKTEEKEEAKEEVKEELSQRELRRLEKQKELEQQEELRSMQEDFLKTEANEIVVDDVELEESTPVRKRGRRKK